MEKEKKFSKKTKVQGVRKNKAKKKFAFVFTTIGDVGGLFVSLIYVAFVAMSIWMEFGNPVINWIMLGITIIYIGFFFFKIFYLNKYTEDAGRVKRIVKISKKYSKLAIRIINATFVTLTLINARGEEDILALIGVMTVAFTFIFTITWDVVNFFVRKKIHDFAESWKQLSHDEKAERIEHLVSNLIKSVNNAAIIDDYFDVVLNIQRMISAKLNDRVRLADARRTEQDVGNDEVIIEDGAQE